MGNILLSVAGVWLLLNTLFVLCLHVLTRGYEAYLRPANPRPEDRQLYEWLDGSL